MLDTNGITINFQAKSKKFKFLHIPQVIFSTSMYDIKKANLKSLYNSATKSFQPLYVSNLNNLLHKSKVVLKINIFNISYSKQMGKDWLNSEIQIFKNNAKILVFQFNQTNTLVLYSDKTKRMGLQDSVALYKSYDFYC